MSLNRIYAIFLRQFYIVRGSYSRLFLIFYWATLDLFLWGVLTVYLHEIGGDRLSFITVIIGAVILVNLLTRVHYGIAVSSLEDVWVRNFINLFASPLTVTEYIGGFMLMSTLIGGVSLLVTALFAWFLFAYNVFQFGFALIPFIGILFLFGFALGMFSVAVIVRFGPAAEAFIWGLPAFVSPFSGVFYPVAALPEAIRWIAYLLPSSYVFEGMRAVVLRGVFDVSGLATGFALSMVYVAVAYMLLNWSYSTALRRGLFTRFLAEAG